MPRLYPTDSIFHFISNEIFFLYAPNNIFNLSVLKKEFYYFIYPSSNVYPKENTNAMVRILEFYCFLIYCKISEFSFPVGKYMNIYI